MRPVYNITGFKNLQIVKEAKRWYKQQWISKDQLDKIAIECPSSFYHPNLFIRVLLFVATLIALSGVTGLLTLMFVSTGRIAVSSLCIFYGIISWVILENVFAKNNHHYKSGVNEAILYHSAGFIIGGFAGLTDANIYVILISSVLVFLLAALRFIDLISTVASLGSLGYLIFYSLYDLGGLAQRVIPFVMIFFFAGFYFVVLKAKKSETLWDDCFVVAEVFSLLVVYAAGNYMVVRELSVSMMGLHLTDGESIPFAWLFYFLTIAFPVAYLFFGIKRRDIVLIRVSIVVIAYSVFTFKYYFSLGHHEITLTMAGIILIGVVASLFRFLKTPKNGYTAENVLTEEWASVNLSSYIISQTMGGNKIPDRAEQTGGSFGGGGSSDNF